MSPRDQIHIALASDQRFLPGLRVTAASIAHYAAPEADLVFHILDGGIQDEVFEDFRILLGRIHRKVTVHRYCVDKLGLKDFPEYGGSRFTYARLLLPSLLPEIRHIIYCDSDFLWRADIAELWLERDDAVIMQSTLDGAPEIEQREKKWFAARGYPFDFEKYFCAGLSFYNLELFRKREIARQVFEFLRRHPDVNFADQSAMNVILFDQVRLLPQRWQRFTRDVTPAELQQPVVLHYTNELPWRRPGWWNLLTDSVLLWHQFNDLLMATRGGSLALFFSRRQVLCKRGLDLLLRVPAFKSLFYLVLQRTGRASYRAIFDTWSRNLNLAKCPVPERIFLSEKASRSAES